MQFIKSSRHTVRGPPVAFPDCEPRTHCIIFYFWISHYKIGFTGRRRKRMKNHALQCFRTVYSQTSRFDCNSPTTKYMHLSPGCGFLAPSVFDESVYGDAGGWLTAAWANRLRVGRQKHLYRQRNGPSDRQKVAYNAEAIIVHSQTFQTTGHLRYRHAISDHNPLHLDAIWS